MPHLRGSKVLLGRTPDHVKHHFRSNSHLIEGGSGLHNGIYYHGWTVSEFLLVASRDQLRGSRYLGAGARLCPSPGRVSPSSDVFAREGLMPGAQALRTKSCWANKGPQTGVIPCPPWLCTTSVQWGYWGKMHTCVTPGPAVNQCVRAEGTSFRENHNWQWVDSGEATGPPVRDRTDSKSAEPSGGEASTHLGAGPVARGHSCP